ncbi:MAG: hypothetical protein QNJ22_19195 [Desulfosarcinaceae bacterium]|nr:hypothetical protein [Desulfosarcinaceae bacterium]
MAVSIHIADTIRSVVPALPKQVTVEISKEKTLHEAALEVGVPPVLIVFAIVDGVRKALDEPVGESAQVHFYGTMAGG